MATFRTTMLAIDPASAGRAGGASPVDRPVPDARSGRSADPGRRRRRQSPRRDAAARPLSAAAGRADDPGPRSRRDGRRRWARGSSRLRSARRSARWSPAAAMPNMRWRRPASACRCPVALTMVEAAAMPETLFTVWTNLFERGWAREGEKVLVHGGTSGIGTMAIALGQAVRAEVIVTAGSRREMREGARRSARPMRSTTAPGISSRRCKAITGGAGVQVVLDMVGGDLSDPQPRLPRRGRPPRLDRSAGRAERRRSLLDIMRKRLVLTGSTLRARSAEFKAELAEELRERCGRMSRPASSGR